MTKLNEEDWNMIDYFYYCKYDVERWCDWEKRKEEIRKVNPELINAYDNMQVAKNTFEKLLEESKK